MITIALYNLKGGVGKTASCVNFAYLAAADGFKTILWDIDPQGSSSFYFKAKPKTHPGIKKLITKDADLENAIMSSDFELLDVIPADNSAKSFDIMLEEMKGMGKFDSETGEWETTPEELEFPEADDNDKADRFEDFEARSSMIKTLEPRLNNILKALKNLNKESFGKCVVCKKDIEMARLEVNPAAQTCKKHLES